MIIDKGKISFEVFPPKKNEKFAEIYETLDEFGKFHPSYISVTYGAGGSRAGKTVEIAKYIEDKLNIPAVAHVTCVGNKKEDIDNVLDKLEQAGITRVLALRGDRPKDMSDEQFDGREFKYASDLVEYIKSKSDSVSIAGACYPEKHFEAMSFRADMANLKEKVEKGCDILITQLFLCNDVFYDFQEKCLSCGITVPIHAGIMPITSIKQVETSIALSGTSVPKAFSDIIARYGNNPEDFRKAGIDYAIRQINDLLEYGADGIHLYSMNKVSVTEEIMKAVKK